MYIVMFDKESLEVKEYIYGAEEVEAVSEAEIKFLGGGISRFRNGYTFIDDSEGSFLLDYPELDADYERPEPPVGDPEPIAPGEPEKVKAVISSTLALREIYKIKYKELSLLCEEEIMTGFNASNGHFYAFDEKDQINFTQQMLLLISNPSIEEIPWKTLDSEVVIHTRDEFLAVCMDGETHKRHLIDYYRSLKANMESAQTWGEIVSIAWGKS